MQSSIVSEAKAIENELIAHRRHLHQNPELGFDLPETTAYVMQQLREYGYDSRRGQQYCGSNGDADVVGLPGVHIECKRVERLNIYDAIEQSKNDARDGENPVVMHRRNRKEWLVTMPLDDWMKMYGKALHDN